MSQYVRGVYKPESLGTVVTCVPPIPALDNMSTKHDGKVMSKGKLKYSGNFVCLCHFVCHESHVEHHGIFNWCFTVRSLQLRVRTAAE
jgi:hypothetical protein